MNCLFSPQSREGAKGRKDVLALLPSYDYLKFLFVFFPCYSKLKYALPEKSGVPIASGQTRCRRCVRPVETVLVFRDVIDEIRLRKYLAAVPAKAIKFLHDRYYESLLRLSYRYTQDIEASRDVLQETFIHVWENARKLAKRHDKPIQHYLVRVVKLKSITSFNSARRTKTNKEAFLQDIGRSFDTFSTEVELIRKEVMHQIRTIVETFPYREKQCLMMRFEYGYSPSEIAEKLQVSVKAVERSITSGRKRLQRYWNDL